MAKKLRYKFWLRASVHVGWLQLAALSGSNWPDGQCSSPSITFRQLPKPSHDVYHATQKAVRRRSNGALTNKKTVVAKKQHFFSAKCLTGEKLSGNILEQLPRATTKVLTTVEIIGNESNFVE